MGVDSGVATPGGSSRAFFNASTLSLAAILIIWQLFAPPALSVADDNDFQKLAGGFCLGQARSSFAERELFDYTNLHWQYSSAACAAWPFRTTAEGAVFVAIMLNSLAPSGNRFDLRLLGAVYGALFLAGYLRLQQALRQAPLLVDRSVQIAFLLMVCNAAYIPLLNTFYFDAATLAAITGALASVCLVALRRRVGAGEALWAALWLGIVAGSKSQHAVVGLAFLPVFWLRLGRAEFAPLWARTLATAVVAAAAALSIGTTPADFQGQATFDALFFRILPNVAHPDRYLADTKIPASWLAYSGQHAFTPSGPMEDPANLSRFPKWFGPADLIRLYFRRPEAALIMLRVNLNEGSRDRVRMEAAGIEYRLGNYERTAAVKPQQLSQFFCLMPRLKYFAIAGRPWAYFFYIVGAVLALWALAPGIPGMRVVLTMGTFCIALMWFVSMLDGVDAGRHLTIFNFVVDVVCGIDLGLLAARAYGAARPAMAPRESAVSRA